MTKQKQLAREVALKLMVKPAKTLPSPFYARLVPAPPHIQLPSRRPPAATTSSPEDLEIHTHWLWGKRYLLNVLPTTADPQVLLRARKIILRTQVGTDDKATQQLLDDWYRSQVQQALPSLIAKWEMLIGVRETDFIVVKMKGKWGSCIADSKLIQLNSELAKKPPECLEYIVVHEMVHLIEPAHNRRFEILMNQFMPKWQSCRGTLNRPPVQHERWIY
jgi:predicted metal-dependent hydrolase